MIVVPAGKFGTPLHGRISDDGAGLVVHLPNGSTRPYPYPISAQHTPIKLQAPDAPPAPETTAPEAVQGKLWRNSLLYQYGADDLYHASRIGESIAQGVIVANWLYLPTFGRAYDVYVAESASGNDYTYSLVVRRRDGIVTEQLLQHTYTGRSLTLSDVIDGAGDKALFLLTPPGQVGTYSGCEEWTLSYNALTGAITASRASLAEVDAAGSGSSSSSSVYNKYSVIESEVIGSGVCGGNPYTLHRYWRQTYDSDTPIYTNRSDTESSEILITALYIAGTASVISLYTATTNAMTWTVSLDHVYAAHQEINGLCAITLVEDIPESISASLQVSFSGTLTQELRINGAATATHNGSYSFSETVDTTYATDFYDAAELVGGSNTPGIYYISGAGGWWQFFNPFTSGVNNARPKKSPGIVNGAPAEFTYRPNGCTFAASLGGIEYSLERSVHPLLRVGASIISPAGTTSISFDPDTQQINYDPSTAAVEVAAVNLSWV